MHKTLVVDDSPTIRRMVRAAGFHVHLPKALAIAVRNLVGPA